MTIDLNPKFTIQTYVVGENNRLAVTASRTVAENPGAAYNPLFIYSQTGLGKTHLLMAIGQYGKELNPQLHVEYLTLDEFVESYHAAVSAGHTEEFRQQFADAKMVLLDDVQFLSHSQEMQAELLRLATEFQEEGKQLVLTSDRPPAEISDLDDRLIERLGGGLVVDIGPPEYETRLAILQRRVEERGAGFTSDVLGAVAEIEVPNVRALLGILNRLHAFQAVSEGNLTPSEARALVLGEPEGAVTPTGSVEIPAVPTPPPAAPNPGPPPPEPEPQPVSEHESEPVPETVTPPVPDPEPSPGASPDEFGRFLSDLAATVTEQVSSWTTGVKEAIDEWGGRGYQTGPLEQVLERQGGGSGEHAVRDFERQIERLRTLEAEMAEVNPVSARDPIFKDPQRIDEAEALVRRAREEFEPPPGPSDAYTLDGFVMAEATKVALQAGRAVIEEPGARYNPLVLVGPSGVGKTHLLHALGRELREVTSGLVACSAAGDFIADLVRAIERDEVPAWRARYRRASAFLLDDVQGLGTSEQTQDELFNLFNLLASAGRQLIFASAVSPEEIEGLDDRLASRLAGGLVANLGPPDDAMKRALIERELARHINDADGELIDYLVSQPADSARSTLVLVQRVLAGSEAQGAAPSRVSAENVLSAGKARTSGSDTIGRTSGVVVPPATAIQSTEKFVWSWPDPQSRILEEMD